MCVIRIKFTAILIAAACTGAHASTNDGDGEDAAAEEIGVMRYYVSAALMTIITWNVFVITLEVNDFRHRLSQAYDDENLLNGNNINNDDDDDEHECRRSTMSSQRYIASFVAIRLGLRDAILDWALIYTVTWAVVGGITWYDVEPNSVLVLWGFSLMFSSALMVVLSLKFPQWLGFYRISQFHTLRDTSGLAPKAVVDLVTGEEDPATINSFRYQVRLGVGKHCSQWVYFLLPFYVNLKVWEYLLSIVIGLLFGHFFLFVVFKCRQRFKKHLGTIVVVSSLVLAILSALLFMRAMQVVEDAWNRAQEREDLLLLLSFFVWLIGCLILQGITYYEHHRFSTEEKESIFFDDILDDDDEEEEEDGGVLEQRQNVGDNFEGEHGQEIPTIEHDDEEPPVDISETIGSAARTRRELMEDATEPSFRQTGYFHRLSYGRGADYADEKSIYKTYTDRDVKCHVKVWKSLPFRPAWDLFVMGTSDLFSCCSKRSEFKTQSLMKRSWFVSHKIIKLLVNLAAIFLAVVACGSTIQNKVTVTKLGDVRKIYLKLNEGKVCAYDEKCGTLQTFDSKEEAHLANYTIAHCGKCSGCSTWNDLELQWSTRNNAAASSQKCGLKSFTGGRQAMVTCLQEDMGWSSMCAEAWAHSIDCAKQNCVFIAIQSMITNRMGNFAVGPNSITAATCNEAQCEQGNPGRFADLSGASRRKMNIRSSILRPPDQQCQIVDDIPRDEMGYNDWGDFFLDPECPQEASPL